MNPHAPPRQDPAGKKPAPSGNRRPRRLRGSPIRCAALLVVLCFAWVGWGLPAPLSAAELTVAAASSLQGALREAAAAYEKRHGEAPTLVFGASGSLAHQMGNGAPFDLFASADERRVARLVREGWIDPGTVAVYAVGTLALVVARPERLAGLPARLEARHLSLLRGGGFKVIALPNPRHAPYGIAARETLRAAGLWEALQSRLVYGENVRQALTYLETGNVEAALVARPLLGAPTARWREIDPALHAPIRQALGVAHRTPRRAGALRFSAFLLSPDGQAIFLRHGFGPAPGP